MDFVNTVPSLVVSLPRNDVDLAKAAVEGGADAIKTHINVNHHASGTRFGSLSEEMPALRRILELGIPTGLVVGGEGRVDRDQMRLASSLGFNFFDVFLRHAPGWYVDSCAPAVAMVALAHDDPLESARPLRSLGISVIEASIVPPEHYGTPLHFGRISDYARLVEISALPVLIPSQHALAPDDVSPLLATGAQGIVVGAVVTGSDVRSLSIAVGAFRSAVDDAAFKVSHVGR